jgi:hypothetical protein
MIVPARSLVVGSLAAACLWIGCLAGCGGKPVPPVEVKKATTWDEVIAAKVRMREEVTAAMEQLRKQHPGKIPNAERTAFLDRVNGMDAELNKMSEEAVKAHGPPPIGIATTINVSLTSEASLELSRVPPPTAVAGMPPGAMPPGMMPPGAMPYGAMPPGAIPYGAMPPGAIPPGAMPPGMMPPGATPNSRGGPFPPGAFPPGSFPPGAAPQPEKDIATLKEEQKLETEARLKKEKLDSQGDEADRIQTLVNGYYKTPNRASSLQLEMTAEQRDVVKEMQKIVVNLRKGEISTEELTALLDKQSDLEKQYKALGEVEVARLQAMKAEERKAWEEKAKKEVAEIVKMQEDHAREIAKIASEKRERDARLEAEHAARMAGINREADAAKKVRDALIYLETLNKQRARKNLPPLNDAIPPVVALLSDKAAAPGTEVQEAAQLKPKESIFVHKEGKWHDARVQTKRGKFVQVVYVAFEDTETVTVERIRTQKQPAETAKAAAKPAATKVESPAANVVAAAEPMPAAKPAEAAAAGPANPFDEAAAEFPLRTWTSTTGTTIEAQLTGVEKGAAILRRADGRVLRVPIDKLAADDQEIVRKAFP